MTRIDPPVELVSRYNDSLRKPEDVLNRAGRRLSRFSGFNNRTEAHEYTHDSSRLALTADASCGFWAACWPGGLSLGIARLRHRISARVSSIEGRPVIRRISEGLAKVARTRRKA